MEPDMELAVKRLLSKIESDTENAQICIEEGAADTAACFMAAVLKDTRDAFAAMRPPKSEEE